MPSAQTQRGAMSVDEETSDHVAECPVGYTAVNGQTCYLPTGWPVTVRDDGGTSEKMTKKFGTGMTI